MSTIIKKIESGNDVFDYANDPFYFIQFNYKSCVMNLGVTDILGDKDFSEYGASEVNLCRVDKGETVELETGDFLKNY